MGYAGKSKASWSAEFDCYVSDKEELTGMLRASTSKAWRASRCIFAHRGRPRHDDPRQGSAEDS